MIEAIKSTLSVGQVTAKQALQSSPARSLSANPDKVQEVAASSDGFYASRNVNVDTTSGVAVLEFRNPLNGDIKTQIPTEAQLEAYQRKEIQDARQAQNA